MFAYVWQLFKFFIVGSIGGFVALAMFYWMVQYGHYSSLVSNLSAGITCQIINFFPQKYWTFGNLERSEIKRQMIEFVTAGTIGVILNLFILNIASKYSPFYFMINKITTDFICTIAMYLFSRFIFKKTVTHG